jgi:hypothetical protein
MEGETELKNSGDRLEMQKVLSVLTPAELDHKLQSAIESSDEKTINAIRLISVDKRIQGADFAQIMGVMIKAEKALAELGDPRFKEI